MTRVLGIQQTAATDDPAAAAAAAAYQQQVPHTFFSPSLSPHSTTLSLCMAQVEEWYRQQAQMMAQTSASPPADTETAASAPAAVDGAANGTESAETTS
jgi:hypothetical protein